MGTKRIKITDDRQGATFRTGLNGRLFDLPVNQELEVDEAMAEHLETVGARFEEVGSGRASSSKEGSVGGLAPIGPHDVRAPGTDAKSLNDRPLAGDQPGDVTAGGVRYPEGSSAHGAMILEDAKASDIRVAAERRSEKDAPIAERMGEGEQGAPKAKPQSPKPSHRPARGRKVGRKKASAKDVAAATPRAEGGMVGEAPKAGV